MGAELKRLLCEPHMYTGTVTAVSPVRGITATTCTTVNECAEDVLLPPFHFKEEAREHKGELCEGWFDATTAWKQPASSSQNAVLQRDGGGGEVHFPLC